MIITENILNEINKSRNVLLHCHPSPDPDSVGSALAFKFALEQLGKNVTLISGDSAIPKEFEFPGVNTIINKSYGEIDINNFDLFIILDSSSKEMITRKSEIIFPENLMTIVIDHHKSNTGYGKINIIRPEYPATAELLYDIFKEINIKIDHDIALNIFMGIYTDTGGFRYENTRLNTFKAVVELVNLAPEYSKTISIMENSKRKEALVFEGIAIANIKTYFGGRLAISTVSYDELIKNNIKEEDISTGYISSKIKSVKGIDISITIVEEVKDVSKLSFRTRDANKYNVSILATALGGGGHIAASGATIKDNTQNVEKIVVQKAKEIYNL
ncbi:MAG: bifunctional oligoribonuclease/PAP phosphatase NrnA [Patescibacteria group bacterium]